jgi:hypothetical protein
MTEHLTQRPRHPKTNEAIRAAVLSWWWSPSVTADRAREGRLSGRIVVVTVYRDSLRPSAVVNYAHGKGYKTSSGRVLAAAHGWGEAGLDCGDGLTATLRRNDICDEWRIVVSGPIGAV